MLTFIIIVVFMLFACVESIAYGYYEIKVNKNRLGGSSLIILALIGFAFALVMYFIS